MGFSKFKTLLVRHTFNILICTILGLVSNTEVQAQVYLKRVHVWWTSNSEKKEQLNLLPGESLDITRDIGTPVDIRIVKTDDAPPSARFFAIDQNNGGNNPITSSNDYVTFKDAAGPLDTYIMVFINNVERVVRVNVTSRVPPLADLVASGIRVNGSITPDNYEVGDPTRLQFTIFNNGQGTAPPSVVEVFIGPERTDTRKRIARRSIGTLRQNEGVNITIDYDFEAEDSGDGARYFAIRVDNDNDVQEDNGERNNLVHFGPFVVQAQQHNPVMDQLNGPTGKINYNTVTFSWGGTDLDQNLAGYEYELNGTRTFTRATSVSYQDLINGHYILRVRAKDHTNLYSEWLTLEFSIELEFSVTSISLQLNSNEIDFGTLLTGNVHFKGVGNGSLDYNILTLFDGEYSISRSLTAELKNGSATVSHSLFPVDQVGRYQTFVTTVGTNSVQSNTVNYSVVEQETNQNGEVIIFSNIAEGLPLGSLAPGWNTRKSQDKSVPAVSNTITRNGSPVFSFANDHGAAVTFPKPATGLIKLRVWMHPIRSNINNVLALMFEDGKGGFNAIGRHSDNYWRYYDYSKGGNTTFIAGDGEGHLVEVIYDTHTATYDLFFDKNGDEQFTEESDVIFRNVPVGPSKVGLPVAGLWMNSGHAGRGQFSYYGDLVVSVLPSDKTILSVNSATIQLDQNEIQQRVALKSDINIFGEGDGPIDYRVIASFEGETIDSGLLSAEMENGKAHIRYSQFPVDRAGDYQAYVMVTASSSVVSNTVMYTVLKPDGDGDVNEQVVLSNIARNLTLGSHAPGWIPTDTRDMSVPIVKNTVTRNGSPVFGFANDYGASNKFAKPITGLIKVKLWIYPSTLDKNNMVALMFGDGKGGFNIVGRHSDYVWRHYDHAHRNTVPFADDDGKSHLVEAQYNTETARFNLFFDLNGDEVFTEGVDYIARDISVGPSKVGMPVEGIWMNSGRGSYGAYSYFDDLIVTVVPTESNIPTFEISNVSLQLQLTEVERDHTQTGEIQILGTGNGLVEFHIISKIDGKYVDSGPLTVEMKNGIAETSYSKFPVDKAGGYETFVRVTSPRVLEDSNKHTYTVVNPEPVFNVTSVEFEVSKLKVSFGSKQEGTGVLTGTGNGDVICHIITKRDGIFFDSGPITVEMIDGGATFTYSELPVDIIGDYQTFIRVISPKPLESETVNYSVKERPATITSITAQLSSTEIDEEEAAPVAQGTINGSGNTSITYQWLVNGQPVISQPQSVEMIDGVAHVPEFKLFPTEPGEYNVTIKILSPIEKESDPVLYTVKEIPKFIFLTSPNGGEDWQIGSEQLITWDHGNAGANVRIEAFDDTFSKTISSKTANDGEFAWIVEEPASKNAKIRVTSLEYASVSDESKNTFSITGTLFELKDMQPVTIKEVAITHSQTEAYFKLKWTFPKPQFDESKYVFISGGLKIEVRPQSSNIKFVSLFPIKTKGEAITEVIADFVLGEIAPVIGYFFEAIEFLSLIQGNDENTFAIDSFAADRFQIEQEQEFLIQLSSNAPRSHWPLKVHISIDYLFDKKSIFEGTVSEQKEIEYSLYLDKGPIVSATKLIADMQNTLDIPPTIFKSMIRNYPNPFNPQTQIQYFLPNASNVSLTIYDVLGQEVSRLVSAKQDLGFHTITWDGKDNFGKRVASGVYIYRLHTESFSVSKKMVLMK